MTLITDVDELEIHPVAATVEQCDGRWWVAIYGDEHTEAYVDHIHVDGSVIGRFTDPNAEWSEAYISLEFDEASFKVTEEAVQQQ